MKRKTRRKNNFAKYGEMLMLIKQYKNEHGYSPTRKELADSMGISKEWARRMLLILEQYGYVTFTGKGQRDYTLNV